MYSLGYIYKKAIYWYGCAAENGHIKGKYWFAKLSLENNSADKETAYQFLLESATSDFGKAFNLLQKNAEDGVSIAQFFLDRYYTLKTDILRSLFGDAIWNKLLPETRHSLVSSAILIKECEGMPPEFDYSGICITAVVALEQELKRVFSDNYINFLNQKSIKHTGAKQLTAVMFLMMMLWIAVTKYTVWQVPILMPKSNQQKL